MAIAQTLLLLSNGTINEDQALLQHGWKVLIGVRRAREFSVQSMDTPAFIDTINPVVALVVFMLVYTVLAALTIAVYAPWRIQHYIDLPAINCTITDYTPLRQHIVKVEYCDAKNESHTGTITVSYRQFKDRNWTVGSVFTCVYKGSFVVDKQSLEDERSVSAIQWIIGFIILLSIELQGVVASIPFINDWGPVPSRLQQYFHVLVLAYHSKVPAAQSRTVSFRRSPKDRARRTQGLFCLALFLGSCVLTVYILYGHDVTQYPFGLLVGITGLLFLALAIYCVRMALLPRFSVDMNNEGHHPVCRKAAYQEKSDHCKTDIFK